MQVPLQRSEEGYLIPGVGLTDPVNWPVWAQVFCQSKNWAAAPAPELIVLILAVSNARSCFKINFCLFKLLSIFGNQDITFFFFEFRVAKVCQEFFYVAEDNLEQLIFLSLPPPKFWNDGHMLPCQAKKVTTWITISFHLLSSHGLVDRDVCEAVWKCAGFREGVGPTPLLNCSHRGCPIPLQLHPQQLQGGLSIKVRRQGAKIPHCIDKNPWSTNAERATFDWGACKSLCWCAQADQEQSASGRWRLGRERGSYVRVHRRCIWSQVVRLSQPSVNCKGERDGLLWCLLQGRNDHEKIWGTQDTRCELLWPWKSLLPVVKEVGLGLGDFVCLVE